MEMLRGFIVSYRRGPKTQKPKEYLLKFPHITSPSEASTLIGRRVAWPAGDRKRKHIGKIIALHGRRGIVRARFRKGIPGEALGSPVEIIG